MIDGNGVVYNNVHDASCYVDKGINTVNVTPTPSALIRLGVGKHTLYCDLKYTSGVGEDGNPITANLSALAEGKCSKVPKVIEK
jgi:hypothetical protein